uniref:Uncharacterized protein n=1 Tax=Oryza sativa subsp. japonica TaxID=39947 RepID=Q5Z704_ORYSJ|nr:hypothetical protein [Oryza sativa Japonica Group]
MTCNCHWEAILDVHVEGQDEQPQWRFGRTLGSAEPGLANLALLRRLCLIDPKSIGMSKLVYNDRQHLRSIGNIVARVCPELSPGLANLRDISGVIFLNDCRDRVTVIVFSASSPTTTLRHPMRAPRLGYLDIIDSPTLATSITGPSHPSLWLHRLRHKGILYIYKVHPH